MEDRWSMISPAVFFFFQLLPQINVSATRKIDDMQSLQVFSPTALL
jgi:hypothetical protein